MRIFPARSAIDSPRRPRPTAGMPRRLLLSIALCCFVLTAVAADPADTLGLERLRGKVVLIDVWASWCEPCRHSFPWLNAMHAKYADRGLVIIGVNVDR